MESESKEESGDIGTKFMVQMCRGEPQSDEMGRAVLGPHWICQPKSLL